MSVIRNNRARGKFTTARLSPTGLVFHTANSSREVAIRFSEKLGTDENIRKAFAKFIEMTGWNNSPVKIMLDTRKVVLVPDALFDTNQTHDYLKINNIDVTPDESIVLSQISVGGAFANVIVVYDKETVDTVTAIFGCNVWFTSVFDSATAYATLKQKKKDVGKVFTTIYLTDHNVYITVQTVSSGDWQYCEILPYSSSADILYYMQELSGCFDISQTLVYVAGDNSGEICKLLRNHYKRAICE